MDRSTKIIRAVGLSALAFMLTGTYAVARPTTESMFLGVHGSPSLPAAWILVAFFITAVVAGYNRIVHRFDLMELYAGGSFISAALFAVLLLCRRADLPGIYFLLYAWKDIYMVVLVEIYYSFTNTVFPIRTARWVYGLFGACAAAGGILGNLSVGPLARQLGTAGALWIVVPGLLIMGAGAVALARRAGTGVRLDTNEPARLLHAIRVVRRSRYLLMVVGLIALTQTAITLIDYRFNEIVERAYPSMDARTAVIGQVYAAVNVATITLHTLTGPILRLAGVPLVLMALPLLLGSAVAAFAAMPRFLTIAVAKVQSKALDYSLFRAGKEILYIPLTYPEKTMGKSVVDILTYRVTKAGASLVLLGLAAAGALVWVTPLALSAIVLWFVLTVITVRRFRKKVSRKEEMTTA